MKQLKMTIILAMLAFATFLPGSAMGVSAQGFDLCAGALENGEGAFAGYTVVYGSGGSGNQIVLGSLDGNDYLSGGSGNDVLCAWGSGNTLDGGSGNDVLIAVDGVGNMLLGGSGNDTLMGYANNTFDGGSGRNDVATLSPVLWIEGNYIMGEGFAPGAIRVTILPGFYSFATIDESGRFANGEWGFCTSLPENFTVVITNPGGDQEIMRADLTMYCP